MFQKYYSCLDITMIILVISDNFWIVGVGIENKLASHIKVDWIGAHLLSTWKKWSRLLTFHSITSWLNQTVRHILCTCPNLKLCIKVSGQDSLSISLDCQSTASTTNQKTVSTSSGLYQKAHFHLPSLKIIPHYSKSKLNDFTLIGKFFNLNLGPK